MDLPLEHVPILPGVDTGISAESIRKAVEEFKVRSSDIICATFPKTGTTVLTWICHQIRTGGHTEFEDLYQVAPWVLLAWDLGMDPNVDGSEYTPRVFKSHLRLASVYRGCKYIVTIRDPAKTSLSFYNFMQSKGVISESMTVSEFIRNTNFVKGDGDARASLWQFYKEYYICRECPNVLVIIYEDMVADMANTVRLIAKFMEVSLTEELVDKVVQMSTKEYMAQHESKLDETWAFERAVRLGRSPDGASMWTPAKRVVLKSHEQVIDKEGLEFLDTNWEQTMAVSTGCKSYKEFADLFRQRNLEFLKK